MNKWNCIIVNDQIVDRLMVVSFVKRFPKLNIVGAFANANEALAKAIDCYVFVVSKNNEGTTVV